MKLAPPLAAPARIFTLLFSEFKKPLIAGPGPTYAKSTEFANSDSIDCGPLSKTRVSIIVAFPRLDSKNPFSIPTIGMA